MVRLRSISLCRLEQHYHHVSRLAHHPSCRPPDLEIQPIPQIQKFSFFLCISKTANFPSNNRKVKQLPHAVYSAEKAVENNTSIRLFFPPGAGLINGDNSQPPLEAQMVKNEYILPKPIDPPGWAFAFPILLPLWNPYFHSLSRKWKRKQFERRPSVSGEPSRRSRCPSAIFSWNLFALARHRLSQPHPEAFILSFKLVLNPTASQISATSLLYQFSPVNSTSSSQ